MSAPASRWSLSLAALAACTVLVVACGSDAGAGDEETAPPTDDPATSRPPGDDPAEIAAKLAEKPWEVISNKGETFLPNVFYADASENEQIMPYAIDGHTMIDRLVYPTLGNPNLYVKGDASDEVVIVLRIEESAYSFLSPRVEAVNGSQLSRVVIPNDASTGFGFFLVPRSARDPNTESKKAISSGTGTDVVRIYPHEIFVNPEPADMPAALKKRKTLRFVFKQGAMAKVPAGLYDLRFEVKKDDEIYLGQAGSSPLYEYQYNALRVFDKEPDEYSIINVTDTQVSIGSSYDSMTKLKLDEFVQFVNTTNDGNVNKAAFITFNGDLHNGGSPGSLRQRPVATTYAGEAKSILDALKHLPYPIFLTAGNHDGYVATGHVPSAVKALDTGLGDSLLEVIAGASPKAWPDYDEPSYKSYLQKTEEADALGGWHRDLFTGGFARNAKGKGFGDGWKEIPRADRNYILYDGFYQWQKTYGPLYYSWKFGKNFYLSMNSFELRQHRRTGWGMYTVNYGGGMSDVQMSWLDRELLRSKTDGSDVILLAHHDPRGGHKAKDPGYYFEQLEYRSVYQSAINYLVGHVWNSAVCKLPDWALPRGQEESCVHDGLQEWMRQDEEFDCDWDLRSPNLTCDKSKVKDDWLSGIELMKRLAGNPQVRTVLLGHTHYNSFEMLESGEELLPGQLPIDDGSKQLFATLEVQNPIRGFSVLSSPTQHAGERRGPMTVSDYDEHVVPFEPLAESYVRFSDAYKKAVTGWQRTLGGEGPRPRELMILRLVSNADLSSQTYEGRDAFGFSVLHLTKKSDSRGYALPQINRAAFFVNRGAARFDNVKTVDLDRTISMTPHDPRNPVEQIFDW